MDMMAVAMSFNRNEEIYGEGEAADYLYKVANGVVRIYKGPERWTATDRRVLLCRRHVRV